MSENQPLIRTTEGLIEHTRVLVKPSFTPPRESLAWSGILTGHVPSELYDSAIKSKFLAVDFETKGGDYTLPDFDIVGIGLAWDDGCVYIDWWSIDDESKLLIEELFIMHRSLIAHNIYFDGGVMYRMLDRHPNWYACTLASYMRCSNEGWMGQSHGLKSAMTEILLWQNSNEDDLDKWLCIEGYFKGTSKPALELREAAYLSGSIRADKSQMWRAPSDILGKYCMLDAEACYLLWTEFLYPVVQQFPELHTFLTREFMYCIEKHVEQKFHGILMDREGLIKRKEVLEKELDKLSHQFFSDEKVMRGIQEIETELLNEFLLSEPDKYKKTKPRPPEPAKFTKSGAPSKAWDSWVRNEHKYKPQLSASWINWQDKLKRIQAGEHEDYLFNPNSGQQLACLLYDKLGYPVVESLRTKKGAPGTSTKALKNMGEIGKILVEKSWTLKELSYIDDYLKRIEHRPTLHPSFRLPGTTTGRLSSKDPNLQQVPKSKAVMSLFRARPGHVFVDLDFSALEPVVATEFSQDPNMLFIYGEGASPNDIYLFVAAHIPGMGEKVRATGYDPYRPTKETLAKAKKECKAIRSIAKTVVLACQYGGGVKRIMEVLEGDNVYLPEEEVRAVWETYWDLFSHIKGFARSLEDEWAQNGGFILNGLGHPMCVDVDYKKDILNRFIQSTGHDILTKYIYIYTNELTRRGIPWKPHVLDWHDASAVEIPKEYLEETIEVYKWGLDELNRQLNGTIRLKGTPSYGETMADIKEPEE